MGGEDVNLTSIINIVVAVINLSVAIKSN